MGSLTVGDVVLIAFPFADFSKYKKRPALIVGKAEFDNLILCQITSKAVTSKRAIPLKSDHFSTVGLGMDSFVRPDKLFTVEQSVIESKVGTLLISKLDNIRQEVQAIFS